jgi:hypothetical protein
VEKQATGSAAAGADSRRPWGDDGNIGAGAITDVGSVRAYETPPSLEAATTALRANPTSAVPGVYCEPVAPSMFVQPLPVAAQRRHWNE